MDGFAPASAAPATGPQFDNRRVLAALIDLALLVPVALALSAIFGGFTGGAEALTAGWALYYYFALESGGGQTLGKRIMKLRVVRADGAPLDMGRVAVRTLLRPIDGIGAYLVGLVVMLATGQRRQRLGDLAAGTVVTDADATTPIVDVPQAPPAPDPVPEFEPESFETLPAPDPDQLIEPAPAVHFEAEPVVDVEPEPIVEPEPEPEPEPAPQPMADTGLRLPPDTFVPIDRPAEPEPEPVVEAEPAPAEQDEPSRLEVISSPIDVVMDESDEGQDDAGPAPSQA